MHIGNQLWLWVLRGSDVHQARRMKHSLEQVGFAKSCSSWEWVMEDGARKRSSIGKILPKAFSTIDLLDDPHGNSSLIWTLGKQMVHIHCIWGDQELYMNLESRKEFSKWMWNQWLDFKVLWMSHLYGEALQKFQVLAWQICIKKEEVELGCLPRTMWHYSSRRLGFKLPRSGKKVEAPPRKESFILHWS